MLMPAVAAGLPPHVPHLAVGASAPQSVVNLVAWLDGIIDQRCKRAVRVRDEDRNVVPGCYEAISNAEYSKIVAALTNLVQWMTEVDNSVPVESLGRVAVSHGGEGVGNCTMVCMKLDPLMDNLFNVYISTNYNLTTHYYNLTTHYNHKFNSLQSQHNSLQLQIIISQLITISYNVYIFPTNYNLTTQQTDWSSASTFPSLEVVHFQQWW